MGDYFEMESAVKLSRDVMKEAINGVRCGMKQNPEHDHKASVEFIEKAEAAVRYANNVLGAG